MGNFARAVRLALSYPWQVTGLFLCALVVGVLWSANIGALYPLVEIAFKGQSPQQWIRDQIEQSQQRLDKLHLQLQSSTQPPKTTQRNPKNNKTIVHKPGEHKPGEHKPGDHESGIHKPGEHPPTHAPQDEKQQISLEEQVETGPEESTQNQQLQNRDVPNREVQKLRVQLAAEQQALDFYKSAKPFVDSYLPGSPFQMLLVTLGFLMLGTLLKSLFFIGHSILAESLSGKATLRLRNEFFRKTLRVDQQTLGRDASSELVSRFTYDSECLHDGLRFLAQSCTREPLKMLACFLGAAMICWRLLFLSLVIVPVGAWAINRLSRILKRANRRAMEGMSRLYGVLDETLPNMPIVRAYTMERQQQRRFRQANREYYRHQMRIARYSSLNSPLTEMIGIGTIALTILIGAYLGLSGETHLFGIQITERPLSLGTLLTFYGLMAGMSDPARKLAGVLQRLQRSAAAADRIYTMLDRPAQTQVSGQTNVSRATNDPTTDTSAPTMPSLGQPSMGQPSVRQPSVRQPGMGQPGMGQPGMGQPGVEKTLAESPCPSVEFRQVRFAYELSDDPTDQTHDVLRGVDLAVHPGETLAVVGPNGCGKSTLLQLILRFYDPRQGCILIDGTDVQLLRLRELRRSIGLVTQEPILFQDTIFNNIRYGNPGATAEEVIEAAQRAHAHAFITGQPGGYEKQLGEQGSGLSGGQKQRIALARAILRDPRVLILDEFTSQVDLESEEAIHDTLKHFIRGRTTLMVTHRLNTLTLASRVAVMHSGKIIDVGTHSELIGRCEFYQRLHELHFRETA